MVARAYAWRGARLWLGVRAAVSLVLLFAGAAPLRLPFAATIALIAITLTVAFIDARRQHELVFVENLGIHPALLGLFLGTPAIIGEALIHAMASFVA
jgi:hypothetical protein